MVWGNVVCMLATRWHPDATVGTPDPMKVFPQKKIMGRLGGYGLVGFVHLTSLFSRDPGVVKAWARVSRHRLRYPAQRTCLHWLMSQLVPF